MFRCPMTGTRLIKARAGGGTLWYSPLSDGRMLTLATARHFFGEDKTREIWMRSERSQPNSDLGCPSCQRPMRVTSLPDWIGQHPINVCRLCRIYWLDAEGFDQVPRGSQLMNKFGDSTLMKDLGESYLEHNKLKAERESLQNDFVTTQPESFLASIGSFLRLPIERSNRHTPEWPIVTGITLSLMFIIQIVFTNESFIRNYGFYPGDAFKNFGLNMFSGVFIHAGWLHLIPNAYFVHILSDDIEDDLGTFQFTMFLMFSVLTTSIISIFISGKPEIAHIGYSGIVMSLFAYYGFQFPKAKMIWLLPRMKVITLDKFQTAMSGWSWFQFPTLWVVLYYFTIDIALYFFLEKKDFSTTAFSSHIAGFAAGFSFWYLFAPKVYEKPPNVDVMDKHMDMLQEKENNDSTKPKLLK